MIHIYTGNGKGKTTAATGLALRACGAGFKVLFLQLFKSGVCSESNLFPESLVFKRCILEKFTWEMTDDEIEAYCREAIGLVTDALNNNTFDMIVIDEFFMLTQLKKLDRDFGNLIKACDAEVVLTGRDAPEAYVALADYVSEIKCIKHPFDKGVECREGIEY